MTTHEELEALYGPPATHSEYRVGERVRYHRTRGDIHQGEIIYVCAPHPITMRDGCTVDAPLSYIIASDDGGMPDVQYQPDIILE